MQAQVEVQEQELQEVNLEAPEDNIITALDTLAELLQPSGSSTGNMQGQGKDFKLYEKVDNSQELDNSLGLDNQITCISCSQKISIHHQRGTCSECEAAAHITYTLLDELTSSGQRLSDAASHTA